MALEDNKNRAQSLEIRTETQLNQSGFPQEGPMTHSIFLSSVRIESHRHHSSRSGEAPAVPSAGLATQRWDRGEEPNLKHRQLARSPWGRAEPGLPGCSETTSTA